MLDTDSTFHIAPRVINWVSVRDTTSRKKKVLEITNTFRNQTSDCDVNRSVITQQHRGEEEPAGLALKGQTLPYFYFLSQIYQDINHHSK